MWLVRRQIIGNDDSLILIIILLQLMLRKLTWVPRKSGKLLRCYICTYYICSCVARFKCFRFNYSSATDMHTYCHKPMSFAPQVYSVTTRVAMIMNLKCKLIFFYLFLMYAIKRLHSCYVWKSESMSWSCYKTMTRKLEKNEGTSVVSEHWFSFSCFFLIQNKALHQQQCKRSAFFLASVR